MAEDDRKKNEVLPNYCRVLRNSLLLEGISILVLRKSVREWNRGDIMMATKAIIRRYSERST